MPGLDDAIAALKDLGSAFLLSFFFPIVLFTAIYCGLVILLVGLGPAGALASAAKLDTVAGLAAVGLVQFALAWVSAPMITTLRRMIEGEMLPAWLKRPMIRNAWRAAEALRAEGDDAGAFLDALKDLRTATVPALVAARQAGSALGTISDPDAIAALRAAIAATSRQMPGDPTPRGRRRLRSRLDAVIVAAKHALETNSAELATGLSKDIEASVALDRMHGAAVELCGAAIEEAQRIAEEAEGELHTQMVRDDIRPSQLGNLRAVMERYTTKAYGVSFAYLWPRIQSVIDASEGVAADIARSKMHIEFGVMMVAGTVLTCAVWLALSFAYAAPWLFLSVGAAGPLLVGLFYRITLEGQKAMTEAVRAAVDTKRTALLDTLGVKVVTSTTTDECALWRDLERWSLGEDPKARIR